MEVAGGQFESDEVLRKILTRLGADDFEFGRGQEFRPRAEEGKPAGADRGAFARPFLGSRHELAVGANEGGAAGIGHGGGGGGRAETGREVGG